MSWILKVLAVAWRIVVLLIKGTPTESPKPRPEDIERVRKLEEQLAADRRARLKDFDAKLDGADRAAADRVLRDVTGSHDDPNTN